MRNIDTNIVGKLVEINWMLEEEKYRNELETSGKADLAVHDVIMRVSPGYTWFNHLEARQQKQLIAAVYDKIAELV